MKMRNGRNYVGWKKYSYNPSQSGFENILCQNLPICNSRADIEKIKPRNEAGIEIIKTDEVITEEYLNKKFDTCNLYDFMELYFVLRFGQAFVIPITAQHVVCVLRKVSNAKMAKELSAPSDQYSFDQFSIKVAMNMHNTSVYMVTLIECNFDISKCQLDGWYYHEARQYRYQIKLSIYGDMSIMYQKIG
jgi:hypothetical protein